MVTSFTQHNHETEPRLGSALLQTGFLRHGYRLAQMCLGGSRIAQLFDG